MECPSCRGRKTLYNPSHHDHDTCPLCSGKGTIQNIQVISPQQFLHKQKELLPKINPEIIDTVLFYINERLSSGQLKINLLDGPMMGKTKEEFKIHFVEVIRILKGKGWTVTHVQEHENEQAHIIRLTP